MRQRSFVIKLGAMMVLCLGLRINANADIGGSITLDHIESPAGNTISAGPVKLFLRFTMDESTDPSDAMWGSFFKFEVNSPDGATWSQFTGKEVAGQGNYPYFSAFSIFYASRDGQGSDTVNWGMLWFDGNNDDRNIWHLPADVVPFVISLNVDAASMGKTVCLDSVTCMFNQCDWNGRTNFGEPWYPTWGGPYCFTVVDCCQGMRGNIDGDPLGNVNVVDAVAMVNYIFANGNPPACMKEADTDGTGAVNILDYLMLRNWMFYGGPQPVACP